MKKMKICIFSIVTIFFFCTFGYADCILIGNSAINEKSLTQGDVKRIFLGKMRKWSNGTKIRPVILKSGPIHEEFIKNYLKKSTASFSSYWKRAIVTGTGLPPKSFETEKALMDYVAATNGAVGYISSDTAHENVSEIQIK